MMSEGIAGKPPVPPDTKTNTAPSSALAVTVAGRASNDVPEGIAVEASRSRPPSCPRFASAELD